MDLFVPKGHPRMRRFLTWKLYKKLRLGEISTCFTQKSNVKMAERFKFGLNEKESGEYEDEHVCQVPPLLPEVGPRVGLFSASQDNLAALDEEKNVVASEEQITGNGSVQPQAHNNDGGGEASKGEIKKGNQMRRDPSCVSTYNEALALHCLNRPENSGPESNKLGMLSGHHFQITEDNDVAAKRIMKLRVFRKRFGEDFPTDVPIILFKRL